MSSEIITVRDIFMRDKILGKELGGDRKYEVFSSETLENLYLHYIIALLLYRILLYPILLYRIFTLRRFFAEKSKLVDNKIFNKIDIKIEILS